ncbi:kinase-like domain-containing protein [Phlyctochytrium arcticum]|nr:kinase-like domain-containing protein [Phlyctochytrium arcticum]KAI9092105.1 kinase-like domain-containing protein [Phlyctochytrium arcticum]
MLDLPVPAALADSQKQANLIRKNSFQEKLGALRGALGRKRSLNNLVPNQNEQGAIEDTPASTSTTYSTTSKQSSYVATSTTLPPLIAMKRSKSDMRVSDADANGGQKSQLMPPTLVSVKRSNSTGKGSVREKNPNSGDLVVMDVDEPSTPTESAKSGILNRPKSGLSKNKGKHLSMPTGLQVPLDVRIVKSSQHIAQPIYEDSASQEALDQLADLKLCSPNSTQGNISVSSSADNLGAFHNNSQVTAQLIAKQAKSLPKISTLFTKIPKKTRASSATPGGETNLVSPVSPLTSNNQLHSGQRKGALSAFEISPATTAPGLHREYHLDDFNIVKRVGKGGFANVFLVRLKHSTGRYYALKAIKKHDVVKLKQEKQILNEKNILKSITHPFIVELYHTFQNVTYLFMTMEYVAGGDLFSYLRKTQRFAEEDARFYVSEVLIALEYLHGHQIVYRDLKPENILLDTTGHTKLADFGFAKIVPKTTQSFCGTPDYIAAEIVANKPYNKAVDWWSLGVLIFELISGKTPFGDESSEKIYENIQLCRIKWQPLVKGPAKALVKRLLDLDVDRRLGSLADGAEIKQHPWFKPVPWRKTELRQTTPPFVPAVDAPEIIERDRTARGRAEDYMELLKNANGPNGYLSSDPYTEHFKNF